jgi:hypothetical protein
MRSSSALDMGYGGGLDAVQVPHQHHHQESDGGVRNTILTITHTHTHTHTLTHVYNTTLPIPTACKFYMQKVQRPVHAV